jgi:hypothetical protein
LANFGLVNSRWKEDLGFKYLYLSPKENEKNTEYVFRGRVITSPLEDPPLELEAPLEPLPLLGPIDWQGGSKKSKKEV